MTLRRVDEHWPGEFNPRYQPIEPRDAVIRRTVERLLEAAGPGRDARTFRVMHLAGCPAPSGGACICPAVGVSVTILRKRLDPEAN